MTNVLDTALALTTAGYSVIPVATGGAKAPAIAWKTHTTSAATTPQIHAWHHNGLLTGIGVICGAVSGGLEMTELEGRAVTQLAELRDLADASGLGDLWQRVTSGWAELSPGGGVHYLYRVTGTPVPGNTKLARTTDRLVLAETRGEGGYVVVAPTDGTHHPTGQPWIALAGGPATCPTLTWDEREAFCALLRTLDQTPEPETRPWTTTSSTAAGGTTTSTAPRGHTSADATGRPGDDYEARVDWTDILTPHGWTLVYTHGRTRYWRRPGKTIGISATTGRAADRDRLYVFSSSTPFDPEHPYTKLGALAVLEFGGDHTAAARDLRRQGYGSDTTEPVGLDLGAGIITPPTKEPPWPPSTPPTPNTLSTPGSSPTANLTCAASADATPTHSATPASAPAAASPSTSGTSTVVEGNLATVHQLPTTPERDRTSWWLRPITEAATDSGVDPEPAHLARQDGHRLFYPGKVNGLLGESESGKTWVALIAVLQAIQEGDIVGYLDFEDSAAGIETRLRAMGATQAQLEHHLDYANPDEALSLAANEDVAEACQARGYALIIVDGVNAAMTLLGYDIDSSNKDATTFTQKVLNPLAKTGATVVTIDHLPKNKEARGKGGIGAQSKRAMMSGCALSVDPVAPFGKGMTGRLKLTVDKDRRGLVRAVSGGAKNAGTAILESHADGTVRARIDAPDLRSPDEPHRPTVLMERASRVLEALAPDGASKTALEAQVQGKDTYVRTAIEQLITEHYARRGVGRLIYSTRPFREAADGFLDTNPVPPSQTRPQPSRDGGESPGRPPVPPSPPLGGRDGDARLGDKGHHQNEAVPSHDDDEPTDAATRVIDTIRAERGGRW